MLNNGKPGLGLRLVSVLAGAWLVSAVTADNSFSPYVDEGGNISFPQGFRTNMVHLGSWFVAEGAASGFHDVYTEATTVEAYRNTGKFPDGATLVKELRAHSSGSYTTGDDVSFANENLKQWFVMIKDGTGRFSDNPLWGDGWGWALYKPPAVPGGEVINAAVDYKVDCLGCHVPARATDLIYVEAYPTLENQ
jgi:hypothetical protein